MMDKRPAGIFILVRLLNQLNKGVFSLGERAFMHRALYTINNNSRIDIFRSTGRCVPLLFMPDGGFWPGTCRI